MKSKYIKIGIAVIAIIMGITLIKAVSAPKKGRENTMSLIEYDKSKYASAVFAGGCFWCMETPYEKINGIQAVVSGYTGGKKENPNYEEVSSGGTGHLESVFIIYDPKKISYAQLLDIFWKQIDPTDGGGQFVDRGDQYRSAIFYMNEEQKKIAE